MSTDYEPRRCSCGKRAIDECNGPEDCSGAKPIVVTLCGSTRFKAAFIDWYQRLTDDGYIVLSVGRYLPRQDHGRPLKAKLDELHLRKIDMSDEILVLDVNSYIGESTANEICYASQTGKTVRYLSEVAPGYREPPLAETDIGRAVLGTATT